MPHDSLEIVAFLDDSSPMRGACRGVYFLVLADKLQYIGESKDCEWRVRRHAYRIPYTDWRMIPVDDEAECKALEEDLILKFSPPWSRARRHGR